MPIDPRVPLGAISDDGRSSGGPLQTLGALMQIKERHDEWRVKQRAIEDDDATRRALQEYERPDDALEELWRQGRHQAATNLGKSIYEERSARLKEYSDKLKVYGAALEHAAQTGQGVTDNASYQTWRKSMIPVLTPVYGDGINDLLPTEYGDGTKVKQLIKAGTSRAATIAQEHNAVMEQNDAILKGLMRNPRSVKTLPDGTANPNFDPNVAAWSPNGMEAQDSYRRALAARLSLATNPQQWKQGLDDAYDNGTPLSVIHEFGEFGEGATERAKQLGLNVKEREDVKNDATRTRVAVAQAVTSARRAATGEEREDRLATGGGSGTGGRHYTQGQRDNEEDERDKEDREIEKSVKEANPSADFNYTTLPDDVRNDYVKRKVQNHDKRRVRLQGLPPILQAAQRAATEGDVDGYEKVRNEYNSLVNGADKLENHVKPPSTRGVVSPGAQASRRAELSEVMRALKTETDPVKIRELEKKRDELAPPSRGRGGR